MCYSSNGTNTSNTTSTATATSNSSTNHNQKDKLEGAAAQAANDENAKASSMTSLQDANHSNSKETIGEETHTLVDTDTSSRTNSVGARATSADSVEFGSGTGTGTATPKQVQVSVAGMPSSAASISSGTTATSDYSGDEESEDGGEDDRSKTSMTSQKKQQIHSDPRPVLAQNGNGIVNSNIDSNSNTKAAGTLEDSIPFMTRTQVAEMADPKTLCLLIIKDKVYDCTTWQHRHPGGYLVVRALCGKDATDSFYYNHPLDIVRENDNSTGKKRGILHKFLYAKLREEEEKSDKLDENAINLQKATEAFHELTHRMEDAGLFETDYTYYYKLAAVHSTMLGLAVLGVFISDQVWVHALAGLMLGLFWQQIAFVGHDVGHNGITHDREIDSYWSLLVGNFLTGISLAWWKRSHNLHHVVTNSADHDPTIQHLPLVAIDSAFLTQPIFSIYREQYLPLNWLSHCLVGIQHWFFYPLMGIARYNLYAKSIQHALLLKFYKNTKDLVWRRELQIAALIGFWIWFPALVWQLPSSQSKFWFVMMSNAFSGVLNVQTALSHFAMPVHVGVTYDDISNGYLHTQLRGTLDVDCPPYMDWFHGGIQFQVAHHLWPRLPRHHLRRVTHEILIPFVKEYGLEYHHATFWECNVRLVEKLRETAKAAKGFSHFFSDALNMNG